MMFPNSFLLALVAACFCLFSNRGFAFVPNGKPIFVGTSSSLPITTTAGIPRRSSSAIHMGATTGAMKKSSPAKDWPFWFILPIAPYQKRETVMEEVVKDKIWTFDQLQGILYVVVPIRMTVIKMEGGGLFVYAPVAPTGEVMEQMRALEAAHGPVRHVVLPTLGLEHKVFAGPFAQKFPRAEVWYCPGQYSFPFKLPVSWLGFGFRKVKELPKDPSTAPFAPEFDYRVVGPLLSKDKIGGFGEAAFFHAPTKTLLVTDVVVRVSERIPAIVAKDPRALLFHARDAADEVVADTPAVRAKGWRHLQQFALFFQPSALETVPLGQALRDARASPMKELGWGGLYPFAWTRDDRPSFEAMKAGGGLLVAPILQCLLLSREVQKVARFRDEVAEWPFERIVPCHLENNLRAGPDEWLEAFSFLEDVEGLPPLLKPIQVLSDDVDFLNEAEKALVAAGTLFPKEAKLAARRPSPGRLLTRLGRNLGRR
mmetsp:Transcript_508/g.574  ORF Transcript_508/g.574 Transcript_508/m.574 type:complete len:484 (-) Transcript_508:248-1699(-)